MELVLSFIKTARVKNDKVDRCLPPRPPPRLVLSKSLPSELFSHTFTLPSFGWSCRAPSPRAPPPLWSSEQRVPGASLQVPEPRHCSSKGKEILSIQAVLLVGTLPCATEQQMRTFYFVSSGGALTRAALLKSSVTVHKDGAAGKRNHT